MSSFPILNQNSLVETSSYTRGKPNSFSGRVAVITLGCAKNQVDSEVMLGVLETSGFEVVPEVKEADVVIVNTCGFLQSAVKESIDCILDVSSLKSAGRLRKLVVAGCMVERYQGDIAKALPEVDAFVSVNDVLQIGKAANLNPSPIDKTNNNLAQVIQNGGRPYFLYDDSLPRRLSTKSHTAYIKISEGCNRPCTFCIIPKIRGPMRSRSIESLVREVETLGAGGVREVNLVAQDLTSFGLDSSGKGRINLLLELLRTIDKTKSVDWVRLLYAYPIGVSEDLLKGIIELPTICNYLDMPLQHSSERVLKTMQRPLGRYAPRKIVEFIREKAPEITLRTTFIVGFPGETEDDIEELEAFIKEGHFLHIGIFTYSREEGTPSYDLKPQIPEKVKQERKSKLMLAQQEVQTKKLSSFVGHKVEVLVEGPHPESDLLIQSRARFQAPEVDGIVIINEAEGDIPKPGSIVDVEITGVLGYDLLASVRQLV